jgi:Mn-dependent DtxR family transcriptional regulator
MKNGVRRNARKQVEEFRKTGAWLNSAVKFDHGLQLSEEARPRLSFLFEACNISPRKENVTALEVLVANLLDRKGSRPVIVSRDLSGWKKTPHVRAGHSVVSMMDKLHKEGLLEMKKGYQVGTESRQTRIWPTERLLSHFRELSHWGVIYVPVNLVELRDEKGRLKDYKDTHKTRRIRSILERANRVNQAADIRHGRQVLKASLVAVFNRKFTLYGRLHTRGYRHYQGYSEDERAKITINGESVIELDYSGMHPHLLYAKEGVQFRGDPYSIIDDRPEVRPFLKQILLCMLNAKDELAAERAANYWLYRNHEERESLKEMGITRAGPLMEAFRQKHERIDHYFCSGAETALRVMNLDATIALDIVDHFSGQGIPILAIHDSFIVQEGHCDELLEAMKRAYSKHTKGFEIPVA